MQKLLSTLLTIIFFQTSIFAFPVSFVAFSNCNSLTAIKELPNNLKETYYATVNASNVENLQTLGYNIGDRVYDYKENPMLLAKDSARIFTSYDMYEAGFNNDNMFYATGLIVGGLALDIAGAPIKAGKGIVKTAKATEKIASKELLKETKLFTDRAISKYPEAKLYQYNATTNPGPLADIRSIETMRASPINNFYGGYYNQKIITMNDNRIIYRLGNEYNPNGEYFVYLSNLSVSQGRIDLAIKQIWTNTNGNFLATSHLNTLYKFEMPIGMNIYDGPINTQGGVYLGGKDIHQIFIPREIQKTNKLKLLDKKMLTGK